MKEGSAVPNILIPKLTENKSLGKSRHRLEENIRLYIKEICSSTRIWINFIQDLNF
jgi:hypothetical protein